MVLFTIISALLLAVGSIKLIVHMNYQGNDKAAEKIIKDAIFDLQHSFNETFLLNQELFK